jgi:4-amino-4-deoxy-L-arabinose transferase-like glycosyltransferase
VREGLSRLPLALVLLAFCFPLFIGLGTPDLANDEAIYSFAVESILRTGDWLSPRSSPNLHIVFLEKPPLKFWIVAAPISLGLLPLDEFGLRFWDAVLGSLAFVYVFLLGRRLAGPVCGIVAVMILFAHDPLIFDHGVRSNNMDAALLLAYCAGVYHYLRWAEAADARARWIHAGAVGAVFYLGFMTKFVAALFLPMLLGVTALVFTAHRQRLRLDLRRWVIIGVVVAAMVLPWFIYQYVTEGQALIAVMFGDHVYTRFTSFADPQHLNPWHYYVTAAYATLLESGSALWVGFGLLVLSIDAVRQKRPDLWIVILWLVLPVTLISLGSSKLYHYFYPYVPPLALAGGYGVAWLTSALLGGTARYVGRWTSRDWQPHRGVRLALQAVIGICVGVAIATAVDGVVRIAWGGQVVFRNTSVDRPIVVAALAGAALGHLRALPAIGMAMLVWLLLPTPLAGYVDNLEQLRAGRHPLRSMGACISRITAERQQAGLEAPGVYAPVSEAAYLHPYFYYLRGSAWHARAADHAVITDALTIPGRERPVILDKTRYAEYVEQAGADAPAVVTVDWQNVSLLLPGPYGKCRTTQQIRPR